MTLTFYVYWYAYFKRTLEMILEDGEPRLAAAALDAHAVNAEHVSDHPGHSVKVPEREAA